MMSISCPVTPRNGSSTRNRKSLIGLLCPSSSILICEELIGVPAKMASDRQYAWHGGPEALQLQANVCGENPTNNKKATATLGKKSLRWIMNQLPIERRIREIGPPIKPRKHFCLNEL